MINWDQTSDVQTFSVSRDQISRETNIPLLLRMLEDFDARIIEMKEFVSTWNDLGWNHEAKQRWAGKLSFAKIGRTWVKRRLNMLDAYPGNDKDRRIEQLNSRNERLSVAAKLIIHQRDHKHQHNRYDAERPHPDQDQDFEDWTADILEDALANSLAAEAITR